MHSTNKRTHFTVAGHGFFIEMPEAHPLWCSLSNYAPFQTSQGATPLFSLRLVNESCLRSSGIEDLIAIPIAPEQAPEPVAMLYLTNDFSVGLLMLTAPPTDADEQLAVAKYALETALMMQYAFATASSSTLLLHASALTLQGSAYAFLGASGAGKSTHSRLWLRTISGSQLLNDDNPVLRILPSSQVILYGSPWSGKTPCYRNASAPLKALVHICQHPINIISPLGTVESFLTLGSASSAFHLRTLNNPVLHKASNRIKDTVQQLITSSHLPVYRLHCRPAPSAAILSHSTIA